MQVGSATSSVAIAMASRSVASSGQVQSTAHAAPATRGPETASRMKQQAESTMGAAISRGRLLDVRA